MKFKIPVTTAQFIFSAPVGLASGKKAKEVFNRILIESDGANLSVTGSDGNIYIEKKYAVGVIDSGTTSVEAERIAPLLKSLDTSKDVTFTVTENKLRISCGRSRVHLQTFDADEYPRPMDMQPERTELVLPVTSVRQCLKKVRYAVAVNDVRNALENVLFSITHDKLEFAASNGHRLAAAKHQLDEHVNAEAQLVVSPRYCDYLIGLDGDSDIALSFDDRFIECRYQGQTIRSNLAHVLFPDFRQVIPRGSELKVRAPKKELMAAVNRIASVAGKDKRPHITLSPRPADNEMGLAYKGVDSITGIEDVIDITANSSTWMEESYNPAYLAESLSHIDSETVELAFAGASKPCIVRAAEDTNQIALVMPLRVG